MSSTIEEPSPAEVTSAGTRGGAAQPTHRDTPSEANSQTDPRPIEQSTQTNQAIVPTSFGEIAGHGESCPPTVTRA